VGGPEDGTLTWRGIGALEPLEEECWTLDEEHSCLGALLVDYHHLGA
jgi:hypothetical protein